MEMLAVIKLQTAIDLLDGISVDVRRVDIDCDDDENLTFRRDSTDAWYLDPDGID